MLRIIAQIRSVVPEFPRATEILVAGVRLALTSFGL